MNTHIKIGQQYYSNMTTKTILVSSYFELRETPHFIKNPEELCPSYLKYFLDLDVPVCLFVGKIRRATRELFNAWEKLYPKFSVVYLEWDYKDTQIYRIYKQFLREKSREIGLPSQRNMEKDTIEYLCLMHSRIEFMKIAIDRYRDTATHFIWADFTIQTLFRKGETTRRQFQYLAKYLCGEGVYFPGCWPKISDENCGELATRIFWRFCGGLFMGSSISLAKLYDTYIASLPDFFEICGGVLSWEVNYWAWLEKAKEWRPYWYYALHTDSILNVSADAYTRPVEYSVKRDLVVPIKLEGVWYPGSAAYVEYEGVEYLNIRYVNYWITPEGYYIIYSNGEEGRTINTTNVCCWLDSELNIERADVVEGSVYDKMGEKMVGLKREKAVSKGVEDIRLFVDRSGELRFIGTTIEYSNAEMNRMIVGKYSIEGNPTRNTVVLREAEIVEPPRESYIEKNWIPFVGDNETYMYQWNGLEMGTINQGKLVLDNGAGRDTTYWMFSKFRGSTVFSREIVDGKEYLVGLVHYSEDHGPRHYYHALVWMEVDTYHPVWVSQVFCFEKLTIEFCIGMKVMPASYVFWISRFDRDPAMFVADKQEFHKIPV